MSFATAAAYCAEPVETTDLNGNTVTVPQFQCNLVLQDSKIAHTIGLDYGVGVEYRPLLNNNIIVTVGAAALTPGAGFTEIYSNQTLYSTFTALTFTY